MSRPTVWSAKPAVPFGGHYRLIDFVLSNLVSGGYLRIFVLTQGAVGGQGGEALALATGQHDREHAR